MNDGLLDPFRHNAWATRELLAVCGRLEPDQLEATAPGTYGSVIDTIAHLIRAEDYYRSLMTGAPRKWDRSEESPSLEELERRAGEMAAFWEDLLAEAFDPERVIVTEDEGEILEIRAGVLIAQVLNHGTDHRSQVLSILTTLGVEHPDLDGWDYGQASGRAVVSPDA